MTERIGFDRLLKGARAMAAATALGSVLAISGAGAVQAQTGPMLRIAASGDTGTRQQAQPQQMLARAQATGHLRVIVGFDPGFQADTGRSDQWSGVNAAEIAAARSAILSSIEAPESVREYEIIPYVAMTVTAADLERLIATPGVTSIVEDMLNEPYLDTSTALIGANRLWNRQGITGTGWSVAVLDTGIRYNHRAFTDAVPISACFSSNNPGISTSLCRNQAPSARGARAAPDCDQGVAGCGHGTHVAGTAAGDLRRNTRGVAFGSDIIPVQVFSQFEAAYCLSGTPCVMAYDSDIIAGMEFVHDQAQRRQIAAVNLSLGGGRYFNFCDYDSPAMTAITQFLVANNVAVVIASGNAGYSDSIGWPACISWAIAVGATNDNDQIAAFSNQAPFLTRLMAPGVNINAPYFGGPRATAELSGTSMAAPHVAGAFALLRSAFPDATVAQMLTALQCTAVPVQRSSQSYPRIDLVAARQFLNRGNTRC